LLRKANKLIIFSFLTLLISISNSAFSKIDDRSLKCLADTIYFEARGEPKKGQELVAKVVLNRVESSKFPNTVCGVVKQKNQFSWVNKSPKIKNKTSYESAKKLARHVAKYHQAKSNGALYFYNPSKAKPSWAKKMKVVEKVGNHVALKPK
jgi:spore germination cell wall hydrolase CwlJ-like protein